MKLDVFDYSHYKDFLRGLTEPPAPRGEMSRIARVMGCQAAYLSQVMRGKAELNEDQMFRLISSLDLPARAAEYLMTLLRSARAASIELREHLEESLQKMRDEHDKESIDIRASSGDMEGEQLLNYATTWMPSVLHVATCCPHLQTVTSLAERFSLPEERVQEILEFLRQMNFVELKDNRWVFKGMPLHIPKSSQAFHLSQFAHRQQTSRALQIPDPGNLHFSSVFAADGKTYDLLKKKLSSYIEQAHREIYSSESDDVYAMTLDLYRAK